MNFQIQNAAIGALEVQAVNKLLIVCAKMFFLEKHFVMSFKGCMFVKNN